MNKASPYFSEFSVLYPYSSWLQVSVQLSVSVADSPWDLFSIASTIVPPCLFTAAWESGRLRCAGFELHSTAWLHSTRCQLILNYCLSQNHTSLGLFNLFLIFTKLVGTPRFLEVCSCVSFGWSGFKSYCQTKGSATQCVCLLQLLKDLGLTNSPN